MTNDELKRDAITVNCVKQLMFSMVTGEIYTILSDELKVMDKYQIPLLKRPSSSCTKCYGRMYSGYITTQKLYQPCQKCANTCVDFTKLTNEIIETETIK